MLNYLPLYRNLLLRIAFHLLLESLHQIGLVTPRVTWNPHLVPGTKGASNRDAHEIAIVLK